MAISPVAVGDIYEVIYTFTFTGQKTMFTLHYHLDSLSGSSPSLADFIEGLRLELDALGNISQQLAGCYSTNAVGGLLSIQKVYPARYLKREQSSGFPTGTNSAATSPLPPNVSMALTLRGDNSGRHFRGTKHLGCLGNNFVTDGIISAGGLLAMQELGDVLIVPLTFSVGGVTCVVSPVVLNRSAPNVSPVITSYVRGTTSRVQRRRTVGLGI